MAVRTPNVSTPANFLSALVVNTPLSCLVSPLAHQLARIGDQNKDGALDLISEDEEEDGIFMTLARAAQPAASFASWDEGESSKPASPLPRADMLDVCKYAAARLAIPWPAVITKSTRSR